VRYEHPSIASLLIGAIQEADLVSPGFEQSRAISNRSTWDFTLHCSKQWIVLPGNASWKRLCSSSVPPDDDDDDQGILSNKVKPTHYRIQLNSIELYVIKLFIHFHGHFSGVLGLAGSSVMEVVKARRR